jgi:hypothetical protein
MTRSPSPARPADTARETAHAPTVPVPTAPVQAVPVPRAPVQAAPKPAARARRRAAWQWPLLAIGAVLAVYLVGRGISELVLIDYGNPASYAHDWGGPSLAGVLAVHSGPGLAIVTAGAWWWLRGRRSKP